MQKAYSLQSNMKHNMEIHYLLSIIAIILAIVLLIITLVEESENHFKIVLEILAHMITFYVSYDIIKQYCGCNKQNVDVNSFFVSTKEE